MQKRTPYFLGLLMVLFFGSSIVVLADSAVCPVHPTDKDVVLDVPHEEVLGAGENLAAVRSQVLLEVFGRVT